jgi:hypothetical protein
MSANGHDASGARSCQMTFCREGFSVPSHMWGRASEPVKK